MCTIFAANPSGVASLVSLFVALGVWVAWSHTTWQPHLPVPRLHFHPIRRFRLWRCRRRLRKIRQEKHEWHQITRWINRVRSERPSESQLDWLDNMRVQQERLLDRIDRQRKELHHGTPTRA